MELVCLTSDNLANEKTEIIKILTIVGHREPYKSFPLHSLRHLGIEIMFD